jgi:SAM-dependent methyltransferase
MFASVVPGMGTLVRREFGSLPGVRVTDLGFDGRSDLILFDVDRGSRELVWSLRTIEDLFVEVGRTLRSGGDQPQAIAGRLWRADRVEKALSVWAATVRPLTRTMTFRVIVRVLQERSFLRTKLREALIRLVSVDKPKWRFADPAQIELWVCEYRPGSLVAGVRLSSAAMRQHDGRVAERAGALRPTVAAMMVNLAGEPAGRLLDPCCGSGTILGEAARPGWDDVIGRDIDPEAVAIATKNTPSATVRYGDVRSLDLSDTSVDAVVTNLPFGRQFDVPGSMSAWLTRAFAEMARVVRPGGRVVVLAPKISARVVPASLKMRSKQRLRLLGMFTTLWVFDRIRDTPGDPERVGDPGQLGEHHAEATSKPPQVRRPASQTDG